MTLRPPDQALHEKGIDFEICEADLRNKSEEFPSVSPYGKVPVLVVGEASLFGSSVANEYRDETHEAPRLMSEDPQQRAPARSWMAFADECPRHLRSLHRSSTAVPRGADPRSQ